MHPPAQQSNGSTARRVEAAPWTGERARSRQRNGLEIARFSPRELTDFHAMQKIQLKVTNALGIHARPSAKIVQLASRFTCSVWLAVEGRRVNARNIVAVMLLAAGVGSTITIETSGPDEKEAIDALTDLIGRGFAAKP
jgi:phosphocarrier protein HPr